MQSAMQEERELEENMDIAILSSVTQPIMTKNTHTSHSNKEEKIMWENYETSNVLFDAGIDPALAAIQERKQLELEAINLDIWHGTDFIPEEDPNNSEQLLDDLEQEDILNELLRNARKWYMLNFCLLFNVYQFL